MKHLLIISIIVAALNAGQQLAWVDQKIQEIKPERTGMNSSITKRLRDPFIYLKVEKKLEDAKVSSKTNSLSKTPEEIAKIKSSEEPLKLIMVMNSSALINGEWYKKGSDIRAYKLIEVTSSYVTLKNAKKEKRIFLNEKNPDIKLNIK